MYNKIRKEKEWKKTIIKCEEGKRYIIEFYKLTDGTNSLCIKESVADSHEIINRPNNKFACEFIFEKERINFFGETQNFIF